MDIMGPLLYKHQWNATCTHFKLIFFRCYALIFSIAEVSCHESNYMSLCNFQAILQDSDAVSV